MLQVCAVDFTAYHLLGALIRGCRDAGWDVEFACADGPFAARLRAEGIPHRVTPISRSVSPVRNLAATLLLAASVRRLAPDVIHTHTPMGGIVGRAAAVLGGAAVVVHTFHGLPFAGGRLTWAERVFLMIERALARRTTHFFSQAVGDVERAVRLGIADRGRITVIGNGVDVGRFRPDETDRLAVRRELGVGHEDVIVIAVARLVREKGLLDLADAGLRLRTRTTVHVILVGDALESDRTRIVRELDAHEVRRSERVRWTRLGHRDDVARLLRGADLFVLPSYREGLPRSVIEALASGLPVIATDIPACRELVDGSVGRIVPVGDPGALAEAIGSLADDPGLRLQMGAIARDRALQRHDERHVVARQISVLRSLVQ